MPLPAARYVTILATVAACAPSASPPADSASLAHAIGALRAETVGDRKFAVGARDSRPGGTVLEQDPAKPRHLSRVPAKTVTRVPNPAHADWPTTVIRFTSTTAEPRTVWVGDTIALDAPTPPAGTPEDIARDLRWTSTEPTVAVVSPNGEVVVRAPGEARVIAWRRVGEIAQPLVVLPAVRGRVATADGAPLRARVVVQSPTWTDTATTDATGAFILRAPRSVDGSATVRIDPLDGGAHAPALLANASLSQLADLDVVLLPARWRLASGSYAGQSVSIHPAIAQGRARDGLRFWHVSRPGRDGASDAGQAVGWSAARLPLAVAFESVSRVAIGSADSAAFWSIARQLERDWGGPLFRPTSRTVGDAPDFSGITVTVDPRITTAGLTTSGWNGDGEVSNATVAVRSRSLLADPRIITHELLHALGIGHASGGWTSVMHPTADLASGGRASLEDVAYGQLLYAVRARARGVGTPIGIAEAAAAGPDR